MGGNALKHLGVRRVASDEAWNIFWQVQHVANVNGGRAVLVPWCANKPDHGDIDILISKPNNVEYLNNDICRRLGVSSDPAHRFKNGGVLSVAAPRPDGGLVQVDLISCPEEHMAHTMLYYSGGGLGMILGRVAAWHGLVFAQEGLRLRADPTKPWSTDILLTSDPYLSLDALGYDHENAGGWQTEEDVWKFGLSSFLAAPHMFLPESTNGENRSRDKGRPSWGRFIEWLLATHSPYIDASSLRWPLPIPWDEAIILAADVAQREDTDVDLRDVIARQRHGWEQARRRAHECGLGAVHSVRPDLPEAAAGPVIRRIHELLPDKEARRALINRAQEDVVKKLAIAAARIALTEQGLMP